MLKNAASIAAKTSGRALCLMHKRLFPRAGRAAPYRGRPIGKKDKGEKKKKWKQEEGGKQDQPGKSPVGTYADGHPFHDIQYLEAKLILKPDRFTSVESFREFGKLVKKTAKSEDVDFIPDAEAGLRPNIREILFLDTPDFHSKLPFA